LEKGKKSKGASRGNASKGTVKKGGKALPQSDVPVSERTGNKKRKAEVAPRLSKREHLSRRNSLYGDCLCLGQSLMPFDFVGVLTGIGYISYSDFLSLQRLVPSGKQGLGEVPGYG